MSLVWASGEVNTFLAGGMNNPPHCGGAPRRSAGMSRPALTLLPGSALRQGEAEDAAAAGGVLDPDPPAVGAHDLAADGQAQPCPAGFRPVARGRRGVELLEDGLPVPGGHARSLVTDPDPDFPPVTGKAEGHGPAGRGVLDGVVREVDQDLLDALQVHARGHWAVLVEVQAHVANLYPTPGMVRI